MFSDFYIIPVIAEIIIKIGYFRNSGCIIRAVSGRAVNGSVNSTLSSLKTANHMPLTAVGVNRVFISADANETVRECQYMRSILRQSENSMGMG